MHEFNVFHSMKNTLYIILLIFVITSCKSGKSVADNDKSNTLNDTLFILPIDVRIHIVSGKKIVDRDIQRETSLGDEIMSQMKSMLQKKYVLLSDTINNKSFQVFEEFNNISKQKGSDDFSSLEIPQALVDEINKHNCRYYLFWTTKANQSSFQNNDPYVVYINPIIENEVTSILTILDKKENKIIFMRRTKSKVDLKNHEPIKNDVINLLKPVYYKKTPNC